MSSTEYRNEADLVWGKLDLIDDFNTFLKEIRDCRYVNAERTVDDLFFEFYPIWDRMGKARTSAQSEAIDTRNKAKFVNETIAPIQSKNDHSKKTGKQNIQWFLIWLHAYHKDEAKKWSGIVRKRYQHDEESKQTANFSFNPFKGEPPSFKATDLAKEWGLAAEEGTQTFDVVSTVRIAFSKRDKILISVVALLAASTAIFWYQNNKNTRILEQYALAQEAPNFNILYLDVDHLGRNQFDRIRNGEEQAPDGGELYSKMFGLPLVDSNLHEDLRNTLFNNFDQVRRELEEQDNVCLVEGAPPEGVTRTNTLFLVIQSIGGSAAYDVRLNMEKITLEDRSVIDGGSGQYPDFVEANRTTGFTPPRRVNFNVDRATPSQTTVENVSIPLGDLLVADGRLIELEAYSYLRARHFFFGSQLPCDSNETAPAYANNREIKISVPTEYVPMTITYRTVLGEEVTQEIRKPNRAPVLQSRGIIIHG